MLSTHYSNLFRRVLVPVVDQDKTNKIKKVSFDGQKEDLPPIDIAWENSIDLYNLGLIENESSQKTLESSDRKLSAKIFQPPRKTSLVTHMKGIKKSMANRNRLTKEQAQNLEKGLINIQLENKAR